MPDNSEEWADRVKILATLIPIVATGISYYARFKSIVKSNEIIQEAQEQGLSINGHLIREVLPPA